MDPQLPSSSSTSSPLLDLPLELLDAIFGQVYNPFEFHFAPLCKRLYPVQQRQFWRRREIESFEHLAAFCRRAPFIPGLETNLVELELCMEIAPVTENDRLEQEHDLRFDEGLDDDDDDYGPELVDPDFELCPLPLFVTLLDRLAALRTIILRHVEDDWVDALVNGDKETGASPSWLGRLESVHVEFGGDSKFLEPDPAQVWLGALAGASSLRALRLVNEFVPSWQPTSAPKPVPILPSLQTLAVAGGSLYSWTGAPSGQVAPNLVRLELSDAHPKHSVVAVLREAPVHLRELVVAPHANAVAAGLELDLDLVLPRLAHLRHLRLAGQSFNPTRLVPYLRSLADLESLAFGLGAPVTDTLLDAILEGPHRLSHLRRLALDHFRAWPGLTLYLLDYEIPDDLEALGFHLPPSWARKRPECPPGGSEAGMRDAVASCAAHDVRVVGDSLGLLEWDDWYRAERQAVILAWASRAKGSWDVARGLVGEVAVEAYRQGLAAGRAGLGEGRTPRVWARARRD